MRKLLAALVAFGLTIGLAMAAEVKFVKVADGKITVKDGDAEKTYKLGENAKVGKKTKEGDTINITLEGDTVTAIKGKKTK